MLAEQTKDETLIKEIADHLTQKGFEDIKADVEGFESPARLVRQSDDFEFTPDATANRKGRKYYFELAIKTDATRRLVTKWKLLSTLAEMKAGKFQIFVPHGNMKFTRELIGQYEIQADIHKI